MSLPYSQPSGQGDKFEPANHNGALLLFFPIRYNPEETTKFGPSTSASTDIINVDSGEVILDAKVFGNLANSLRNDCGGGVVLGRLGQGVNTKGNPPWILMPFDETVDPQRADPLLAQYKAGQFKQPASSASPAPAPTAYPVAPQGQTANGAYAPQVPGTPPPQQWAPQPPVAAQPTPQVPAQQAPGAAWGQQPPATPQAGWNAPTPAVSAPTPPPTAAPPAAPAAAVDPGLVEFLTQRGVTVQPGMDQATCEAIARTFPS